MKRRIAAVSLILIIGLVISVVTHRVKAQDGGAAAAPSDVIDQFMTQVGQNQLDNAVSIMDGLKVDADLKQSARNDLIRLRNDQGQYHGYDIADTQRFSSRFQTIDVLAYYDQQPALLRFHFYRPDTQNNGKWDILGFQVHTDLPEIVTMIKDATNGTVGRR
jgi:hypothetical protein